METINHLDLIAKNLLDGRIIRLRHIQDHDFNLVEFLLRAAFKPRDNVLNSPALKVVIGRPLSKSTMIVL